jgi:hypothetical protein
MSTEYTLYESKDDGSQLLAHEHSSLLDIVINDPQRHLDMSILNLDVNELRTIIIRLIEVGSYISADSMEFIKRFNVNYGDKS